MQHLLKAILEQWKSVIKYEQSILTNFSTWPPAELMTAKYTLTMHKQVLMRLQAVAFDMFEPINMTTIIRDSKYQYGESHYQYVEITAEQAFGKPYCGAEEWYKNEKLQALYPNKYSRTL